MLDASQAFLIFLHIDLLGVIRVIRPSLQGFKELAEPGKRLPVMKTLDIYESNPIKVIKQLGLNNQKFVLLESGKGSESLARYSFIAIDPWLVYETKGNNIKVKKPNGEMTQVTEHPYNYLEELMNQYQSVTYAGLPKFYGGAVGFISYDMGRHFEEMPEMAKDDLSIPESYFLFVDKVLVFDRWEENLQLIVLADIPANSSSSQLEELYKNSIDTLEDIEALLLTQQEHDEIIIKERGLKYTFEPEANMTKEQFEEMVVKAKEYIKAGDIFQVNLSIRLGKAINVTPLELYSVLREVNPSPYMCYIDFGDMQIVGSSPELLVRIQDGYAETRPIAGTRRRGEDREEDLALAKELISNEKERAEHIMLVDLERNDLGRVCKYGSVEVNELMVIEEYSHVMHIVSNVRGELADDRSRFDLLKATFPGGTITGAPKIRSMEIIEELEPTRRGVYTGSIGFLGFGGEMEMNITIRTLVIKDGKAYVQAGAGIVADSVPEKEYFESLKKAEALLRTLEIAEELFGNKEEQRSA
jgi:anthranilate synthase component I